MDRTTVIRADGKSPLSSYVDLLVSVPANLEMLLDRDAEAVRILTATPALPEAIQRAERSGGIVLSRRIWTRRDERRVNMLRGLSDGYCPQCRAARYLDRLQPRSGASPHDKWFRLTVDEARRDGTAAVLCPNLEQAKAIYERLISAARSAAQDDGGRSDFDSARIELGGLTCELMNWTKQPGINSNTTPVLDGGGATKQAAASGSQTSGKREPQQPDEPVADTPIVEWIFAPSGTGYSIAGFGESGHVGKLKGFAQIARLIRTPRKPVLMLDLVGVGNDDRITADKRSQQPALDSKAMRAIFEDREKTKAELERAECDQDNVEAKRCREHISKLKAELSTGMGIGGKIRDLNNLLDKLRPQIWGTLKTAIKKLREAAPSMDRLAEHFELSISAEGVGFVYLPPIDPPPVWSTELKK